MAVCLTVLSLIFGICGSSPAQTQPMIDPSGKSILILHSSEGNTPIFRETDKGIADTLVFSGIPILNQYYESLDLRRNPSPEHRKMLVEQMRARYGHRKIDLIITMYPEALHFLLKECRNISPEAPVIALYLQRGLEIDERERRIIAHTATVDVLGTLEIALRLVPGTKRVYVVSGSHEVDKRVEAQARLDMKKWEGRLEFIYLSNMPMGDMEAKIAAAPPKSIILLLAFSRDVRGKSTITLEVARRLSRVSDTPIFGILESSLWHGIVGGSLLSFGLIGQKTGQLALEILGGAKIPENIPEVLDVATLPMFDWRQLRRWNMDEDALPKGSIVINREPQLWDYKYYIMGFLAFSILETALIVLLMLQKRKKTEAEASLRKKTEELDQFFNVTLDLLAIADSNGYFVRVNPAMEKILGHSREDLTSRPFIDFVHPDDVSEARNAFSALVAQNNLFSFENRFRCKDGTYRWLQWNSTPAGDMIYAAARDLTAQRQMESEAWKLRDDLARVTRASTLGGLTGAVAHEINQPLAAILSNAQAAQRFLARGNPDMKEIAEILEDITRDDLRAAEVIRKIRSMLKKEEIRYESLNLNDIVHEILNIIHKDTILAEVSIEEDLDPALAAIRGDRIQLQQVILNLVLNAMEALKNKPSKLRRVIVRTSKKDEHFAEVSVRDFGPGIEADDIIRLFEPFYTTKSGGLGMGLAISKDIVKSHGGEIRAVNNPYGGATFSFTVPFDREVKP